MNPIASRISVTLFIPADFHGKVEFSVLEWQGSETTYSKLPNHTSTLGLGEMTRDSPSLEAN